MKEPDQRMLHQLPHQPVLLDNLREITWFIEEPII